MIASPPEVRGMISRARRRAANRPERTKRRNRTCRVSHMLCRESLCSPILAPNVLDKLPWLLPIRSTEEEQAGPRIRNELAGARQIYCDATAAHVDIGGPHYHSIRMALLRPEPTVRHNKDGVRQYGQGGKDGETAEVLAPFSLSTWWKLSKSRPPGLSP